MCAGIKFTCHVKFISAHILSRGCCTLGFCGNEDDLRQKTLTTTFLSMLCAEFAMLLDAGLTIGESINAMLDDEPGKEEKALFQGLTDALERGEPFSGALRNAGIFPHYTVHMVEIGERTGRLVETLTALSEYYDRQERLAKTIKSAVLYPAILLVLMVAVVLILVVQVLPIFSDVFARLGSQMSPLAVRLMQFGGWLGDVSVIIAVILGFVFVAALFFWFVPGIRKTIAGSVRNRWGDRGIIGSIASARFNSAMTLAMASGLAIADAVQIASNVSGGARPIDKKHEQCIKLLDEGKTLTDAMCVSGILSPSDGKLLSIGGRSGKSE